LRGVRRAEHSGPRDEHRGARRGALRRRVGVDSAVDLDGRVRADEIDLRKPKK